MLMLNNALALGVKRFWKVYGGQIESKHDKQVYDITFA